MAFTANTLSLSSIKPVKLVYNFNALEQLNSSFKTNSSNLSFITHDALKNSKDVALSKHTALTLTDSKDLKTVFTQTSSNVDVNRLASSFYLEASTEFLSKEESTVKVYNGKFYLGGKGETAVFYVILIEPGVVELRVGDLYVQASEEYPFTLTTSTEPLLDEEVSRQRFFMFYTDKSIAFQTKTKHGLRYLASGTDRTLRFVGANLNETKVNNYMLKPTFITPSFVSHDFDPSAKEVKYYNELSETDNQKTTNIKKQTQLNTNLLVSCPSTHLAEKSEVGVNISLTKTNFSTLGTFNTSL